MPEHSHCKFCGDPIPFGEDDKIGDVDAAVREALGFDGFILRNGYSLLDPEQSVGSSISDGDVVDVIPDPEGFFK